MPSNFPTSYDALSNPSSTTKMNDATVPHAAQHANANDAIEALEAFIGIRCHVVKANATSRASNATPTLDNELFVTLEANKIYRIEAVLFFDMPADGIQVGFSGTVTATLKAHFEIHDTDLATSARISALNSFVTHTGGGGHGAEHRVVVSGIIQTTVAGTFGISWSQASSNPTALTIESQSMLRCSVLA
jgi:hypothetical protein